MLPNPHQCREMGTFTVEYTAADGRRRQTTVEAYDALHARYIFLRDHPDCVVNACY